MVQEKLIIICPVIAIARRSLQSDNRRALNHSGSDAKASRALEPGAIID